MSPTEQPIPSVWTRGRRGREQPALSRDQIVAEAVRLLDAEGPDALSMRRLGTRLEAGATSLYRHVASRDELIELVVDEVYGEIRVPTIDKTSDWRAAVRVCAESIRSMILRHPWIATMLGQVALTYLGPNVNRLNDRMLALFVVAGLALEEAVSAISTVVAYVVGIGISEASWLTTVADSGQTEQEWVQRLRPAVEAAAQPHPMLRESHGTRSDTDPRQVRDDKFAYGLERIIDGLAIRVDAS